jgi:hypothetical protein
VRVTLKDASIADTDISCKALGRVALAFARTRRRYDAAVAKGWSVGLTCSDAAKNRKREQCESGNEAHCVGQSATRRRMNVIVQHDDLRGCLSGVASGVILGRTTEAYIVR